MNNDQIEIQKVINKFYSLLSGKAGEKRDWQSFRKLFFHNAIITNHIFSDDNKCATLTIDVDKYIAKLEKYLSQNHFYEKGKINKFDFFCNIAQVDSSFMAKQIPSSSEILKSGKNFIQFLHDGESWKIVSMLWEND